MNQSYLSEKTKCFLLFGVIKLKFILVPLSHITSHTTDLEYNKIQAILIINENCAYVQELFNCYPNLFDRDM